MKRFDLIDPDGMISHWEVPENGSVHFQGGFAFVRWDYALVDYQQLRVIPAHRILNYEETPDAAVPG